MKTTLLAPGARNQARSRAAASLNRPRLEELHTEEPLRIRPDTRHREIRCSGEIGETLECVLVAGLGMQALAAREADLLPAQMHDLVALADQMQLDAAVLVDPHGAMLEALQIEVGAELAVQMTQCVDVELRRDAGRIVVRTNERARVLA